MRYSDTATFTSTGESNLFSIPGDYVGYLMRLAVSNRSGALATVNIIYYNGSSSKTVIPLQVADSETASLSENELPEEGCPTKIAVDIDGQPIDVGYSVDLR